MKGVRYLIDDEGNKTHVVLDLNVWSETWQEFFQDDEVTLLAHSTDGLQGKLNHLEQDLPSSDLDAWLEAFNRT